MKQIRIASEKDSNQIADLRIAEYKSSKDFKLVQPGFLEWGEIDKKSLVIGVFNEENRVIATILLTTVENIKKAVKIIEYNLPIDISFPAIVLRRAATKKSYRKKGFNQLLRYYCIQAALEYRINSLLSPVFKHAPRTTFMKDIGYQFYTPFAATSQEKLIPFSIRKLAVLERSKMTCALKMIKQKIPDLIREYPWKGQPIII